MSECECRNWARNVDLKYLTNHHPRCSHYNDSLMDVWKVSLGANSFYVESENAATEIASEEEDEIGVVGVIEIAKERMHREVFEHLPEFEGF